MTEPLTPADVQSVLDRALPGTQIRFFENTTATSQQAADNIGCALGQIVKSICFLVELEGGRREPIVVLTSGDQKVDDRKIAEHYGVGRKKVKVATAEELIGIYGYPPGSVPPVGHRTPVTTFIDSTLARWDMLYAAGGAHNAIFPLTLENLLAVTGGTILDVVRPPGEPGA
ncbi:MAG: YbaK/EbsC family protein [Pleurocapsa minor GSE-CHR-MK-17-07R]|jgi:prolyl-tRNA editing enzyme YbaK/EbsC (Cys-tRNA(Pro) deacylase)|nr:YbaK/EbsC family protein [Pleurocapsa minor GSE-CHR-MK 17-07R]